MDVASKQVVFSLSFVPPIQTSFYTAYNTKKGVGLTFVV
jgi:hypothetical protein